MKLEVSVKNSALILADIIIYCPGYRLASAPNMNQANSQLGKQTKKDMSAGGSAETQRIKPILAAVRQAEQIRDKPHSISQKRYLVLRFKSYGVLTNKIEFKKKESTHGFPVHPRIQGGGKNNKQDYRRSKGGAAAAKGRLDLDRRAAAAEGGWSNGGLLGSVGERRTDASRWPERRSEPRHRRTSRNLTAF